MWWFILILIGGALTFGIVVGVVVSLLLIVSIRNGDYDLEEHFVRCSRCGHLTMLERVIGVERYRCRCGYLEQVPPSHEVDAI